MNKRNVIADGPITILHVGELNFTRPTGSGQAVASLIEGQVSFGNRVIVVVPEWAEGDQESALASLGASCVRLGSSTFPKVQELAAFRKLIEAAEVDVVHFHSGFVPRNSLLARLALPPYIVTPHGAFAGHVLSRGKWKKLPYLRLLEKAFLKNAAAIVCLTRNEENDVRKLIGDAAPTFIIPNAVPSGTTRLLKGIRRMRLAKPRTDIVRGIFLGRLDIETKGLDRLATIVGALVNAGHRLQVDCYGLAQGSRSHGLLALSNQAKGGLRFHGPVYGAEKAHVLAEADFYIQVSRSEGFPISVIEAMGSGIPTFVSESLGPASLFAAHRAAILLPPNPDEAASVLRNHMFGKLESSPSYLSETAERGMQFVDTYLTPEAIGSAHQNLLLELLS